MPAETMIWLGLTLVFLIVEAACPIHLVSIWFAAGALTSVVVSMLGGPVWLQVLLFLAVSGALLALLWPVIRKYVNPKLVATNVDALVGATAVVIAAIDNMEAEGQVKLNGIEWTARSTSGQPIPVGTHVKVDRIEGVKAFVSPTEAPVGAQV